MISGLGCRPFREAFSNFLKSRCIAFLYKRFRGRSFIKESILSKIEKRVRLKGVQRLSSENLEKLIQFLQTHLPEGKQFAIATDDGAADILCRQIQSSSIGHRLWAHYDPNHKTFNQFRRHPICSSYYDIAVAPVSHLVLLTNPQRNESDIRYWKAEVNAPWNIVLPFHPEGSFTASSWENRTPTFVWVMPFAGTARFLTTFVQLAEFYKRPSHPCLPKRLSVYGSRQIDKFRKDSAPAPSHDLVRGIMELMKCQYPDIEPTGIMRYYASNLESLSYFSFFYSHEYVDLTSLLQTPDLQTVVLVRDPRDMIVSAYFRLVCDPRNLSEDHPFAFMKDYAAALLRHDSAEIKEKCLMHLIEGGWLQVTPSYYYYCPPIQTLANQFVAAKRHPQAYCISFEEIRTSPKEAYRKLIAWLNWNPRKELSDEELEKAIHLGSFEAQTGGLLKEGDDVNHTIYDPKTGLPHAARKGTTGEWRNHFTRKLKDHVKDLIGDQLIELGYEKNKDW